MSDNVVNMTAMHYGSDRPKAANPVKIMDLSLRQRSFFLLQVQLDGRHCGSDLFPFVAHGHTPFGFVGRITAECFRASS